MIYTSEWGSAQKALADMRTKCFTVGKTSSLNQGCTVVYTRGGIQLCAKWWFQYWRLKTIDKNQMWSYNITDSGRGRIREALKQVFYGKGSAVGPNPLPFNIVKIYG